MVDHVPTWAELIGGWELFRDPILCAILAGLVLGLLGVFVVLRRMVFVTAALSQAAGMGVALAFYVQIHLGLELQPMLGAVLVSLAATAVFALPPDRLHLSRESVLGLVYLAAGAGAVILGDRIAQEAHDIAAILFGAAVLVRPLDLLLVALVGAVVTTVLLVCYRGLLFAAYDPDAARVHGLPVRGLDLVLWLLVALQVSVSTRALGVLPVFAFAVLPAIGALLLGFGVGASLLIAAALGAISGGAGYLAAFFLSLPVGAAQAATAVLLTLLLLGLRTMLRIP